MREDLTKLRAELISLAGDAPDAMDYKKQLRRYQELLLGLIDNQIEILNRLETLTAEK